MAERKTFTWLESDVLIAMLDGSPYVARPKRLSRFVSQALGRLQKRSLVTWTDGATWELTAEGRPLAIIARDTLFLRGGSAVR